MHQDSLPVPVKKTSISCPGVFAPPRLGYSLKHSKPGNSVNTAFRFTLKPPNSYKKEKKVSSGAVASLRLGEPATSYSKPTWGTASNQPAVFCENTRTTTDKRRAVFSVWCVGAPPSGVPLSMMSSKAMLSSTFTKRYSAHDTRHATDDPPGGSTPCQ